MDPERATAEAASYGVARPSLRSAPIAATAMAGSTILLFASSISNPLLAVAPVGMWAKASISPLSELAREAGEAEPVGKADSPHSTGFLVNLPRRAVAEALVLAFLVVETEPGADASLGLGDRRVGVEIDFLVFEASPQPLDEDVVHAPALAVQLMVIP